MFNVQTSDVRENFRNASHLIANANGFTKANPKGQGYPPVADVSKIDLTQLTQGYLLTMCDINPQTQQMQFSIVDTQQVSGSPVNPLMRLLSMQDSFIVGSMSYFLMVYYFTGNQQNPNFTGPYYWSPYTYPSPTHDNQEFGPGFAFFDPGMSLFWSTGTYISIEVDKKVVIPYWDTLKHLYVPQTQANAAANPMLGPPNVWPYTLDQYDGSTDAGFPVEPTVIFGGGRQNVVKLNLPANVPGSISPFSAAGYGTNYIVKACLKFNGILAQNSTSVR